MLNTNWYYLSKIFVIKLELSIFHKVVFIRCLQMRCRNHSKKYDWTIKMRMNPHLAVDDMWVSLHFYEVVEGMVEGPFILRIGHGAQLPKIAIKVDFMG